MAVDLANIRMEENMAIQEAASAGLKSMEHLIRVLSSQIPSASSSSSFFFNLNFIFSFLVIFPIVSTFKHSLKLTNTSMIYVLQC